MKNAKAPAKQAGKKNAAPPPRPAETKALARQQTQSVATSAAMADMLAQDAGAGLENAGSADYAVPRLSILQKLKIGRAHV